MGGVWGGGGERGRGGGGGGGRRVTETGLKTVVSGLGLGGAARPCQGQVSSAEDGLGIAEFKSLVSW